MHTGKRKDKHIARLIERCLAGDEMAWNEFFLQTGPLIAYLASQKFRRMGFPHDHQDIENIRQDIHLSLWQEGKLATIRDRDKAIPWICAITNNSVSNYARKSKAFDLPHAGLVDESILSPDLSPIETLSREDINRRVKKAIDTLSDKQRTIIKLLYFYEKSYREISEIMNMPLGTVLISAHRARFALKRKLQDFL